MLFKYLDLSMKFILFQPLPHSLESEIHFLSFFFLFLHKKEHYFMFHKIPSLSMILGHEN